MLQFITLSRKNNSYHMLHSNFFCSIMGWVGDGGGSHNITMELEDCFCLLLVSYCIYLNIVYTLLMYLQ